MLRKGEKAVRYAVRKVERALLNYALVFRMLIQFTNSFNVSVSGRICMFTISNSFEVCASVLGLWHSLGVFECCTKF